jgi:hypothetical protein
MHSNCRKVVSEADRKISFFLPGREGIAGREEKRRGLYCRGIHTVTRLPLSFSLCIERVPRRIFIRSFIIR